MFNIYGYIISKTVLSFNEFNNIYLIVKIKYECIKNTENYCYFKHNSFLDTSLLLY